MQEDLLPAEGPFHMATLDIAVDQDTTMVVVVVAAHMIEIETDIIPLHLLLMFLIEVQEEDIVMSLLITGEIDHHIMIEDLLIMTDKTKMRLKEGPIQ